jgi:hypothetical protein
MLAARNSVERSSEGPILLIGWPLQSVSPVSLALGARPDLNRVPSRNRPGTARPEVTGLRTFVVASTGIPGMLMQPWKPSH